MSSPETIDFSVLARELPGANPAGSDLRLDESPDSLLRRIKGAREESSTTERKNLEDPAQYNLADCKWAQVQQLCEGALAQHTKDFEIAAWLCESLVRNEGFAGLRDALRLIRELAEKFWDDLYPTPDGDDLTPRIRLLGGVFKGALLLPIKRIPITADGLNLLDLDKSTRLQKITDAAEREKYVKAGARPRAEFQQSVAQTSDDFYRDLTEDLQQAIDELDKLETVLIAKCGTDESGFERAPSMGDTSRLLEECRAAVKNLLGDRPLARPAAALEPAAGVDDNGHGAAPAVATPPSVTHELTRESAFRTLSELAAFFRRTEPHSPISHHLEQVIRWGNMSLPELLQELIADEKSRLEVFTRVGIDKTQNDAD